MQFGSSTMFFRELPVTRALEVIARASFAGAEVWIEHLWRKGGSPAEVKRRARELGLTLSVHATSYDVNICSTNPGIRRESIRQMVKSLQIAAQLGASTVAMHPGHFSSSRDTMADFWDPFVETLIPLDEKAAEYGLHIGMEAMEKRMLEFFVLPRDVLRLFERNWQAIGLTIDLAHAQTAMNPLEYLAQIPASKIVHAHCSDNSPQQTHMPLGRGRLDLPAALAALHKKYDGMVILEGYEPGRGEQILPANADYLRTIGFMK